MNTCIIIMVSKYIKQVAPLQLFFISEMAIIIFRLTSFIMVETGSGWFGDHRLCNNVSNTTNTTMNSTDTTIITTTARYTYIYILQDCVHLPQRLENFISAWPFMGLAFRLLIIMLLVLVNAKVHEYVSKYATHITIKICVCCFIVLLCCMYITFVLWEVCVFTQPTDWTVFVATITFLGVLSLYGMCKDCKKFNAFILSKLNTRKETFYTTKPSVSDALHLI